MRILSYSAKFSDGNSFSAAMASTFSIYHFGAVASRNFGEWKYASNYGKMEYRRLL